MSKFVLAGNGMTVNAEGTVVTKTISGLGFRCAAGPALGPAGVHWAEFVIESGGSMFCGLILDGWDVAGGSCAEDVDGHCFFGTTYGARYPATTGTGRAASPRAPRATASACGSTWAPAA